MRTRKKAEQKSQETGTSRIQKKDEHQLFDEETPVKKKPKVQKKKESRMESPQLFQLDSPIHKKLKNKKTLFDSRSFNIISGGSSNESPLTCSPVIKSKMEAKRKKGSKAKTSKRKVVPRKQVEIEENVPDFDSIEKFELVVETVDTVDRKVTQKVEKVEKVATSTPAKCLNVQKPLKFRPSAILPCLDDDLT